MSGEPINHEHLTTSPRATFALGEALGRSLVGGVVIGLTGPLGAGKTYLVKGIAGGNAGGASVEVTSPTFTLVNEYTGTLALYHLDSYRLPNAQALLDLGFDEMIRPDTAVVVEWADRVRSVMPSDCLWIELAPKGETDRRMSFAAYGDAAGDCLTRLRNDRR